jgi:hypothetical protein
LLPIGSHRPLQQVLRAVHELPGAVQVPEARQYPDSQRFEQHAAALAHVAPLGAQVAAPPSGEHASGVRESTPASADEAR